MSLGILFETLKDRSIKLKLDDQENLKLVGQRENLDPALLAEVKKNKDAIIQWLKRGNHLSRPSIVRVARGTDLPSSYAQERLWFIDQMSGGKSVQYNMPVAMRVEGRFDKKIAEQVFAHIIQRHEPLRTVFVSDKEGPRQCIQESFAFRLMRQDLTTLTSEEKKQAVRDAINADAVRAFDLSADLMLRASFLTLAEDEGVLLLNMHHIASDGWSMGILMREFVQLYKAFLRADADPLPPLRIQYADYAQWQRNWLKGEVLEQQLSYWEKQLADLPQVHGLIPDWPRPAVQAFNGAMHIVSVDSTMLAGLRILASQEQATLFMVLHSVFALLLSRHANNHDIVIGTAVANRQQRELELLVGFFVNTLVLRADCSGHRTFREYLEHIKKVNRDAQLHQDVSLEQLIQRVNPHRSASYGPLFQIMFSMNISEASEVRLPGLKLTPLVPDEVTEKFDLTFTAKEQEHSLQLRFTYNCDLFDSARISRMCEHMQNLLQAVVANPDAPIETLPLLSQPEKNSLLYKTNETSVESPETLCFQELFEAQVERTPQSRAVVYEGHELSYRELNAKANQLAHHLRTQGVKPETPVGICMDRSLEMVVAILAILKAGGAYVPLDSEFPIERLRYMIGDARLKIIISQSYLLEKMKGIVGLTMLCADQWEAIGRESSENLTLANISSNLAYVIYTSGSTGKPKGVGIEHRQVVNYVQGVVKRLGLGEGSYAMVSTPAADLGNTMLFPALVCGGNLHVISQDRVMDGEVLAEYFDQQQIDYLKIVPSHLLGLQQGTKRPVMPRKKLIVGGEASSWKAVRAWTEAAEGCRIYNHYGPTETTVGVLTFSVQDKPGRMGKEEEEGIMPLGRSLENSRMYVLDNNMELLPTGAAGELFIGGRGVGRGYLNRADLTAARFVPNPFSENAGERLYRTGDRVRYLSDGNLEFLGRVDDQVKIRGFRIELGEIEQQLAAVAGVNAAVVIAREDGAGQKRLVAYLAMAGDGGKEADVEKGVEDKEEGAGEGTRAAIEEGKKKEGAERIARIRRELQQRLPDYMVPTAFVVLERLPLTGNGKVDRKALPEPGGLEAHTTAYVAPQNAMEQGLCEVWQEVLRRKQVGIQDNFFEVGGNSILAAHLIKAVNHHFGTALEVHKVFQMQTIRDMAEGLNRNRRGEQERVIRHPNLLQVKPGESSVRPVFMVHPVGGYAHCYRELALHLEYPGTVYGLEVDARSHDESIEEMAKRYCAALTTVQPEGPYLIGGWSMGGVVAYEMARQLQYQNVRLLMMLDSWCPAIGGDAFSQDSTRDEQALLHIMASELGISDRDLGESERAELASMRSNELLLLILRVGKEQDRLPLDFSVQMLNERFSTMRKNHLALRAYRPLPMGGEIHLVRAEANRFTDPMLGWDSVAEKVSLIQQSGDHFSMMRRPHVTALGRILSTLVQAHSILP